MQPSKREASVGDLAKDNEHSSADAVARVGAHFVVVGSAGSTDATPDGANPIFADGARYHGWMRAVDDAGAPVWTRRVEGGREIHIDAIAPVGDGFVVAGGQRAGDVRAYTAWVARYDARGEQRWRVENLGEAGVTSLQAIAVASNGSLIAGGTNGWKSWLVAFTADGQRRWEQQIPNLDKITALATLGDVVVGCGITGRTTLKNGTSRLFAVSAAGELRWSTALPPNGTGELRAIAMRDDGGVAVGQADHDGRDGAWIVRFGADGEVRDSRVLDGKASVSAQAVTFANDGGFVATGVVVEKNLDRRVMAWRFDRKGTVRWEKSYGDASSVGIAIAADDSAVLVGSAQAPGAKVRPWIFAIDPQGAVRWTAP